MSTLTRSSWVRLRRTERCVICGHLGWCTRSADGTAVNCARTPSPKPIRNKTTGEINGYLHRPHGGPLPQVEAKPPVPRLSRGALLRMAEHHRTAVSPARLARHAASLGVSVENLRRLRIGWDADHSAWSFPMVGVEGGPPLGFRLRRDNGRKFAIEGGTEGLFIPDGIVANGALVIVEGPTSLAALLDLGVNAIGRPSCNGGVVLLKRFIEANDYDTVIVLADRDEWKKRRDGSTFRPGPDGGRALARELRARLVMCPVVKDARDWKAAGANAADVRRTLGIRR